MLVKYYGQSCFQISPVGLLDGLVIVGDIKSTNIRIYGSTSQTRATEGEEMEFALYIAWHLRNLSVPLLISSRPSRVDPGRGGSDSL